MFRLRKFFRLITLNQILVVSFILLIVKIIRVDYREDIELLKAKMRSTVVDFFKSFKNHDIPLNQQVRTRKTQPSDLFVLMVSSRENFSRRQAIRKTWAASLDPKNYKFAIGKDYCKLVKPQREPIYFCPNCNCKPNALLNLPPNELVYRDDPEQEQINIDLLEEQKTYQDLFMIDILDTYQNLTAKVKSSFRNVVNYVDSKQTKKPTWILKVDDDVIAFPLLIEKMLKTKLQNESLLYAGKIVSDEHIQHKGLWAENVYQSNKPDRSEIFPPYASGAAGVIISYPIAEYIHDNFDQLINYSNEDTALGIWLEDAQDNSKLTHALTFYSNSQQFSFEGVGKCKDLVHDVNQYLVLGHRFTPEQIEMCWNHFQISKRYQEYLSLQNP